MSRWQSEPGREHDWVSGQQARCRDELIILNAQRKELTGQDYYLYTSRPGDGQVRVVFTDAVVRGYAAGLRHMQAKMALEGTAPAPPTEMTLRDEAEEALQE